MSTSPPALRPPTEPTGLLAAVPRVPDSLDHDTRLRYGRAAELLDRLCRGLTGPVRILEVGCNVLNLLPAYFDPDRVHVTRCDTLPERPDDPNYVRIDPAAPLPFADRSFDAVAALEVLEHLPPERRRDFLAECLRVARRGAVWTCPNGAPEVEAAERLAAAAYEVRNGRPHPFLSEHRQFGLPREEEVRAHLQALDCPHAVFDQAPLGAWLAGILLSEPVAESGAAAALGGELAEALAELAPAPGAAQVPYRKVYVAARTFDATAALEEAPLPSPAAPAASTPPDDALFPGTAETLSRLAGRLLARMRADQDLLRRESEEALGRAAVREEELRAQLRREREEWAAQREALFDEWQREWAEIQAEYGRALDARDAARREVLAWHQRARILDEVIRELSGAPSARLAAPLRLLARKLFRRRLTERGLIVWSEVRPHTPETADPPDVGWLGHLAPPGVVWESAGPDPQFVLPGLIPAGWVRIRLRLTGKAEGQAEIYYDDGGGFRPETKIDTFDWIDELTIDVVTRLPRAARAFRLDPLSGQTGTFRVEQFSVESLPPAHALAHALRRKIGLLSAYHCLGRTLRRGLGMLLRGRFREALGKVLQAFPDDRRLGPAGGATRTSYDVWRRRHALTDADRERIRSEVATWADPPLISVLMPVYNPRPEFLERALDSVRAQLYPHWQLCVTDDASTDPRVRSILRRYAKLDQRIEVEFAEANGGISAASNRSLARARGAYVALLDHDDELAEHALFRVAETVRRNPDADMIYSDEDKLDPEGRHVDPFFKPDWAPEYFLTCMYTCHLSVFRTELARAVGGFRSAFDLAQDYDLALRVVAHVQQATRRPDGTSAESERIAHIPDVLYHWRMAPTSTATGHEAKPQAELAARRAVESYLERIGRAGTVERGPSPGLQRVRFRIVGRPKVSIVIPTAGKAAEIRGEETWFVAHCVESIRRRTTYDNYEVLVVDNDDLPAELQRRLDELGVVRVSYTEPFNLARKLNLGAAKADGEYLILLNDDTEVITPDWIEAMLEYAQWPEIGAVGAKLFFADGHIQHAGVTFVGKLPFHHFYNHPGEHPGYWGGNVLTRNYSAVTGACVMVRAELFHELGGFDPSFPLNFNDIDFCMKVLDSGRRIVHQPNAQLYHFEAVSKAGTFVEEIERFLARHGDRWECDPMYSPHLTKSEYDYRIG